VLHSGAPPRDPIDRILIATACELAATFMTRDREIIAVVSGRR